MNYLYVLGVVFLLIMLGILSIIVLVVETVCVAYGIIRVTDEIMKWLGWW